MKGLYKRIISGVLVLVTIFLMCSPVAFASSEGSLQSYQPETFWGWLQSVDNSSLNFWKSLLDKDICPKSPNTNGLHEFVKTTTTVDGKTGLYYVCRYCGKSAGEVGEEAYQQQVSTLPAPGYNSAGRLIWQPSVGDLLSDATIDIYYRAASNWFPIKVSNIPYSDKYSQVAFLQTGNGILMSYYNISLFARPGLGLV